MTFRNLVAATAAASMMICASAHAAVTADDAAKLKSSLTPLGGEKAGNKDGTIPAWDGGYTKVPPGWKQGELRPDPFANDKPTLQITGKNVDQYSERLSDGVKALLKKYPTFRLDVYPTHRTAAAPQWVYDNTFKNATRAKTKDGGISIEGAYGGVPFPIPHDGSEVMWNHLTSWLGESAEFTFRNLLSQTDGKTVLAAEAANMREWPYYYKEGSVEKFSGAYSMLRQVQTAPPFRAGESLLVIDSIDMATNGRQAWQYLVGQRRVRRAPTVAFDTPDSVASGQGYFDEVFVFNGSLEMYQWKLLGKKEIYVPYNTNRLFAVKDADIVRGGHVNPDSVRWELHRVWVVEASLAPGKRHVVPKRRFYIDEDSWHALLADGWDAQGQLWRTQMAFAFVAADGPGVFAVSTAGYNLLTGALTMLNMLNEASPKYKLVDRKPAGYFTPESLAGQGVR